MRPPANLDHHTCNRAIANPARPHRLCFVRPTSSLGFFVDCNLQAKFPCLLRLRNRSVCLSIRCQEGRGSPAPLLSQSRALLFWQSQVVCSLEASPCMTSRYSAVHSFLFHWGPPCLHDQGNSSDSCGHTIKLPKLNTPPQPWTLPLRLRSKVRRRATN